MKSIRHHQHRPSQRAGLAPLELVLYLPIMLFVMALMVNFGNIAAWKIRAQSNTRYAGTRTLDDRTGHREGHPENWPDKRPNSATLGSSGGQPLDDVDAIWDQNPDLTTPVVRGPVIVDNDEGMRIVVAGRFPIDGNVHAGDGHVDRKLPLLRGLYGDDGKYGFTEHQEFLDNRWEYRYLKHPHNPYDRRDVSGDSGNRRRRAKRWYRMDPEFFSEINAEMQQVRQAHSRLKSNPSRLDLDPLDRDVDFYAINLARRNRGIASPIQPPIPEGSRIGVPDFHPKASVRCEVDLLRIQLQIVNPVINRVEKLPGSMAQRFISLYSSEIRRMEAIIAGYEARMQVAPPQYQAEIDRLQVLLDQVNEFYRLLPRKYQR